MDVLDLKSKEDWQAVLHEIADKTKMTVTLTDDKGNHILHTQGTRCPLCSKIREKKEALTFICSQCNTAMLEEAKQILEPVVDFCDAGLTRMVVPIVRDGVLIGQLTACGGAAKDEEIDLFLVAQQVGITEEEVQSLADTTPAVSTEEVKKVANMSFADLNP
jgi:ligand-binding sensor protein